MAQNNQIPPSLPMFDFRVSPEQKAEVTKALERMKALSVMIDAGEKAGLDFTHLKEQLKQATAIVETAVKAAESLG